MGSRSFRLEGPARRIAIAIAVVVALLVAAIAVAIWRYEASRDSDNAALRESQTQLVAQQARTALTDEGGIVSAYASNKDPADLFALQGRRRQLRRALDTLQASDALSAAERDQVRQIEAAVALSSSAVAATSATAVDCRLVAVAASAEPARISTAISARVEALVRIRSRSRPISLTM